jgi:hypothetical protein
MLMLPEGYPFSAADVVSFAKGPASTLTLRVDGPSSTVSQKGKPVRTLLDHGVQPTSLKLSTYCQRRGIPYRTKKSYRQLPISKKDYSRFL